MQKPVRAAVEAIAQNAWQTIADYPNDGEHRSPKPSTAGAG